MVGKRLQSSEFQINKKSSVKVSPERWLPTVRLYHRHSLFLSAPRLLRASQRCIQESLDLTTGAQTARNGWPRYSSIYSGTERKGRRPSGLALA